MDPYAYSLGAATGKELKRYFGAPDIETEDEDDMRDDKPNRFMFDLPADEYYEAPGLSGSIITHGIKSILHMRDAIINPRDQTAQMRWGTTVHKALLEPESFEREYVVFDGSKRGNEYKEFAEANIGKSIITSEQSEQLLVMIESVHSRPDVKALLTEGQREVSMFWIDLMYGQAKGRMDVYSPNHIVDLKTTGDLTRFKDTAARLNYHMKMGWYQIGVREITRARNCLPCYIVAVESDSPFDCRIFEYDSEALAIGRDTALRIAAEYRKCERAGRYPGICEDVTTLKLPQWMIERELEKIDASTMEEMEAKEL